MNQNAGDFGHPFPKEIFDGVGNLMGFPDAHFWIHAHVQVDGEVPPHPAGVAFADRLHSADGLRQSLNLVHQWLVWRCIHQLLEGGSHGHPPAPGNDASSHEGGDLIGDGISWPTPEGYSNTHSRGEGGDRVAAVMPCIRPHDETSGLQRLPADQSEEDLLDGDDSDQNEQRPPGRSIMSGEQSFDGMDGDTCRCRQKHPGDEGRCERFGLAMTVGVVGVRGLGGHQNTTPDDEGGKKVGKRFDGIGHEGVGMAEDSGGQLADGQNPVDDQTDQCNPDLPLFS